MHRKLTEAPEQLLRTSALENFILNEIRQGKVYKTFPKSKRQLIYSNNKIYVVKKLYGKFEIKTVISLQMGRERNVYIDDFKEKNKMFY